MEFVEKCSGIGTARWQLKIFIGFLLLGLMVGCSKSDESNPIDPISNPPEKPDDTNEPPEEMGYTVETFVSGLTAPQGIEMDDQGRLWVAEQGTGASDGRISVIDQNGDVYPFLTNIPSAVEEDSPGSAHHLLIEGDTLWAVVGITSEVQGGDLIKLDISGFTPGDTPLLWDQGYAVANVADLVLNHNFNNQTNQSNAYNLTKGPNGNIYVVDAAANAVIMFNKSNDELSVLAELPTIANSTGVGPPSIDAVPTGIIYSNGRFLVSAFVGFPFTPGNSRIFSVSPNGNVSTFESGFTGAVDIIGDDTKYFLVEYGTFGDGFQFNTGKVILIEGDDEVVIADDLNFPNGICSDSAGNLYIASIAGSILKLTKE